MDIQALEQMIREMPELYGKISHESEVARYNFEVAEQNLSLNEAKLTLRLLTNKLEGESVQAQSTRIKNKVIEDLHTEVMQVLMLKTTYKKLELEADTLSKKIMLLCKSADIWQTTEHSTKVQEKSGNKMFPIKSKMGE
jgi:hypothetical protein